MKTRVILSIVFVSLGLILAATPKNTTQKYKLDPKQMLDVSNNMDMYFSPDQVADLLIKKDPSIQLIDVRTPDQFEKFALPNAINIPLTEILSDKYRDVLDQGIKYNIFYSNGNTDALKAWMITKQLGWQNNFVLQGGLNYWAETIMNPQKPATTNPNDEIAKYEFRKGAQKALSGDTEVKTDANAAPAAMPVIKKKAGKKRVQGGC